MSAFRGRLPARALVIDVPLLGDAEARHRVVDAWRPASGLYHLPDGSWLLEYDEPVEMRAELAPGLVLVDSGGVLHANATPTDDARPGDVLIPRAGETMHVNRARLLPVDRASWFDLTDLRVEPVVPLDRPVPAAPAPQPSRPPAPTPDLRGMARVAEPSARARRLLAKASGTASRTSGTASGSGRGTRGPATPGGPAAGGPATGGRWGALLTRLVLATPAADLAARARLRYVRELSAAFGRRDWDTALREAVGFAGTGGTPTLRLPRPRTGDLVPHARLGTGGALKFDQHSVVHLRALYRQAATELEHAGRIQEAAFVLADLLDAAEEAVGLLERHGHLEQAAALAEGRDLDPNLTVRLWWRAGDRDRAVEIARSRGAFAGAVERLSTVDATAASELRAEWVRARQAADDHVGAVDAAWPDEALRPLVATSIEAGMALGGHRAGYLSAHQVTWRPTAEAVNDAVGLLDARDPDLAPAQGGFLAALAGLACTDRAQDRRLCTAALRLLVRDPRASPAGERREHARIARALRDRADRLAAADLPPVPAWQAPAGDGVVEVAAPPEAGQVPIHDAVVLSDRTVLVAYGELGARLIGADGRTRAGWDVPAHRLVVADHGGNVVLAGRRGAAYEMRSLDLSARRLRPAVALAARYLLPSYDGALVTMLDEDGIAFVDISGTVPRIAWRELDATVEVLDIDRAPTSLAALVRITDQLVQAWRWDLPSLMLRTRPTVDVTGTTAVLASGTVVTSAYDETTGTHHVSGTGARIWPAEAEPALLASGGVAGVRVDGPRRTVVEILDANVRVTFPTTADPIGMRHHAGTVTLWDRAGRLVAVDLGRRVPTAHLRTRL